MSPRQQAYHRWLQTPAWRAIREQAGIVHGNACVVCGESPVQWHHLFYAKDWNDTLPAHLMPMCRWHHLFVDDLPTRGRTDDERQIEALCEEIRDQLRKRTENAIRPSIGMDLTGDGEMFLTEDVLRWLPTTTEGYRRWVIRAFDLIGEADDWLKTANGRRIPITKWYAAHKG